MAKSTTCGAGGTVVTVTGGFVDVVALVGTVVAVMGAATVVVVGLGRAVVGIGAGAAAGVVVVDDPSDGATLVTVVASESVGSWSPGPGASAVTRRPGSRGPFPQAAPRNTTMKPKRRYRRICRV
jgi:hypothetical protein